MKRLYNLTRQMIGRYIEHDIGQIGGQLAYFALLSIFPFIIFINRLISILNFSYVRIADILIMVFPENIVEIIMRYIEYISESHKPNLLSVGIIMLIYSSSRIVRSMEKSINLAYEITEKRSFLKSIMRSMLFVVCLSVIILLMLAVTLVSRGMLERIFGIFNVGNSFVSSLLIVKWAAFAVIVFPAMSAIYYLMPNRKIKYVSTLPGAALAVAGFALLSAGFGIYVRYGLKYSLLYGSIGAVFLLLIWLYSAGIIIVMGAEFNSILMKEKEVKYGNF